MRTFLSFTLCVLLLGADLTLAATSNDFQVRLFGAADTEPPTEPVISSVTPVSSTQIDVVWTASTDNVQLDGYQVFRDTIQIATTTLTSYNDTGLTASTTYSYEVRAFDWQNNYSTTSAAVATTTLNPPAPAPTSTVATSTDNSRNSASGRVVLQDFMLSTDRTSATLEFETNRPTRFVLRWGRTDLYNGGYVANDIFRFTHGTTITGLEPGTTYEYELIAYTPSGIPNVLKRERFTTSDPIDRTAPGNVFGLTATTLNGGVQLSWQNPPDTDLAYVRVMRNHLYYPVDIADGGLVYQGLGEGVFDEDAFAFGQTQYYTVFSVDREGNVSSGAIVTVTRNRFGEPDTSVAVPDPGSGSGVPGPLPTEVEEIPVHEPVVYGGLDPENVAVLQGERRSDLSTAVSLDSDTTTIVRVPYDAVPERLKSIIISFTPHSGVGHQAYLLKIDPEKRFYEARFTTARMSEEGVLEFAVYDFEEQMVHYIRQQYRIKATDAPVAGSQQIDRTNEGFLATMLSYAPLGVVVFLFILSLLLLYWLVDRNREKDKERTPLVTREDNL